MSDQRLDRVITDAFSKSGFFKVRADAFGIDRLQLDFVSLDDNDKSKLSISIYISIYKAVAFANDVLSGRIPKLIEASKQKAEVAGDKYPASVFEDYGGMSVAGVKAKANQASLGKYANDNKAVSRVLRLSPGTDQPYVFTATQCAGREVKKGAIVPEKGATQERIQVGCDSDKLKEIAYGILIEWDAYIKTQYMRGNFKSEWNAAPEQKQQSQSYPSGNDRYNAQPPPQPLPSDFDDEPL